MTNSISADEARRLALHAQGLLGTPDRRAGVPRLLHHLGAVQLDTISVLARSHELVPYARLGPVGRSAVERSYWSRPATAFEYWAHAACVLPVAEWPTFGFRRLTMGSKYPIPTSLDRTAAEVLAQLRDSGPLTATDLGGAKRGGPWWDWSDVKIAAERLFNRGDIVVTERRGWRRVYDLPERALPGELLGRDLPAADAHRRLVTLAGRALGVATAADLADYYRLSVGEARAALPDTPLVPVSVEGWPQPAWADPDTLELLGSGALRGLRSRSALLSPFDSLVWFRDRAARIFGMDHRLEAYVPAPRREHGYFAMPVLAGGRLVARVDPARAGGTLVARHVSFAARTAAARAGVAAALASAAEWVGCDTVMVERVTPEEERPALEKLLAG